MVLLQAVVDSSDKEKSLKSRINLHYNISFGDIMGEADMVVGRTLFEIKTSKKNIATTSHLLQTVVYRALLRKRGIRIDKIVLVNPLLGETYSFQITPAWKDTFRVYNEIIPHNPKLQTHTAYPRVIDEKQGRVKNA